MTSQSVTSATNECVQCGTSYVSRKRSCCARGGTWFNKCGDAGDTKFDHTWSEGVQACKKVSPTTRLYTTTILSTPSISIGCVKCGVIKKSGKRSCCARGGDWFKKCGDAADTTFNHTWSEGV